MPKPKILAVIGARSGSKTVPHKNIRPLLGKPLLGWIIEAAKGSRLIDRIVLSTDSVEYAEIGKGFGAEAPFLRPADIAGDLATDLQYIRHALTFLKEQEGYEPDIVCRLFPTTPLTMSEAIDATIQKLIDIPEADSSQLVAETVQNPFKMYKVSEIDERFLEPLIQRTSGPDSAPVPRQLYPKTHIRANMIVSRVPVVMEKNTLFGDKMAFHVVPIIEGIDVDHEYDFLVAEAVLKKRLSEKE